MYVPPPPPSLQFELSLLWILMWKPDVIKHACCVFLFSLLPFVLDFFNRSFCLAPHFPENCLSDEYSYLSQKLQITFNFSKYGLHIKKAISIFLFSTIPALRKGTISLGQTWNRDYFFRVSSVIDLILFTDACLAWSLTLLVLWRRKLLLKIPTRTKKCHLSHLSTNEEQ
jgi:hypothetical protein